MFQITVLVVTMPSSNIPCKKNQTWESSIAVFEAYLGAKITNIHRHLLPKKFQWTRIEKSSIELKNSNYFMAYDLESSLSSVTALSDV